GLIWQQCDGENTVTDIAKNLGREFDVDQAEVADDVLDFVTDLKGRGWLIDG
ncbi:MAG: PqqD family protein, partial [Gammaproteobacteria bacterium]|nr:PqqD family protein [Gammaproteobacteria bacterium]